jgi:alcohol dehydrogenase (cytochrome c)/quinohemoprotein ethanol dehydrogenase
MPEQIVAGANAYGRYCMVCHGDAAVAGGLNPDLRHSGMINKTEAFRAIVVDGALQHKGMVSFQPEVIPATAEEIRLYVIKRANEDKALEGK